MTDTPKRPPAGRPPRRRPPSMPSPRRRKDAVSNALIVGIIATIVAILLMLAAALTIGDLGGAKAPRTYIERQISTLQTVVQSQPNVGRAWADLAKALIESGQLDRADDIIRQGMVAAAADKAPIMVEKARVLYKRGKFTAALKAAEDAIAEANKVRDKIIADDRKKGIMMDPRAMPMDPIISAAILESVIYQDLKQPQKAVDALTVALVERPNMTDVLTARGQIYLQMKDYDDARKDFTQALTFVPDYADALKGLAALKAVTGK